METNELDKPTEASARWMNDNDLGLPLKLVQVNKVETDTSGKQRELVFETSLGEKVRRTTGTDKPEYSYIYNQTASGNKVFQYRKNKAGFRVPETA